METIRLTRISREDKAVRGIMRVNGRDIATLENADYIIPEGNYPVSVTFSPRFKRILPLIGNMPGRSGIRIHRGTRWFLLSSFMYSNMTIQHMMGKPMLVMSCESVV